MSLPQRKIPGMELWPDWPLQSEALWSRRALTPGSPRLVPVTPWLRLHPKGKGPPNGADDEDDRQMISVNGRQVWTSNGSVDEPSVRAATQNMTDEERARFRFQANQQAGQWHAIKKRQEASEALSKQVKMAEYRTSQQAIAALEARLGRRPQFPLTAFWGVPGEVYIIYLNGNLPIPVRNGVIDEKEYLQAEKMAKEAQRVNMRMDRAR